MSQPHPVKLALWSAFGLIVLGWLLAPESVMAQKDAMPWQVPKPDLPNPLDVLPSINPTDILNPANMALEGFQKILQWLFGSFDELGQNLVRLLLAVPLLADTRAFPRLNEYREFVAWGSFGILGLSFVVATIRMAMSSMSGGDVYGALMGFVKTIFAVGMLLLYVPLFDAISRITNEFTRVLIENPIVGEGLLSTTGKLAAPFAVGVIFSAGGLAVVLGIVTLVLVLILLVVKVVVTSLLAVLFVAAPLAIALWPIDELSWALRNAVQAALVLLCFPLIWAICFGVFAVLPADALFPGDHGDGVTAIIGPLLVVSTLIVAYKLPFVILRQAMNAGLMPSVSRRVRDVYLIQRVLGP